MPIAAHVSAGDRSWLPCSSMPPMTKPVSPHGGGADGGGLGGGGLGGGEGTGVLGGGGTGGTPGGGLGGGGLGGGTGGGGVGGGLGGGIGGGSGGALGMQPPLRAAVYDSSSLSSGYMSAVQHPHVPRQLSAIMLLTDGSQVQMPSVELIPSQPPPMMFPMSAHRLLMKRMQVPAPTVTTENPTASQPAPASSHASTHASRVAFWLTP